MTNDDPFLWLEEVGGEAALGWVQAQNERSLASLESDPRFDGRFFIGVTTTGIYCRPICPAPSPKSQNVRYFPSVLPDVRTHQLHLLDLGLFKNFSTPGGTTLQLRFEWINALNYTVLWNPDLNPRNATFGLVNQDRNNPRDIQLGARLTF